MLLVGSWTSAAAQNLRIWRQAEVIDPPAPVVGEILFRADERGTRTSELLSYAFSPVAEFRIVTTEAANLGFGDDRVNRTLENRVEFRLETRDESNDRWITSVSSTLTRQDVSRFGFLSDDRLFQHRTYSLAKGWRTELWKGMTLEIFAGIAQCRQIDDRDSRFLPFGGVRLERAYGWGRFMAGLSQGVEGGGSESGLYGSQLRRRLELRGAFPLGSALSLQLDCELSTIAGAFQEEDLLREAPIVTASASLRYRISEELSGSVGYSHRRLWSGDDGPHGASGPMASASLTYRLF